MQNLLLSLLLIAAVAHAQIVAVLEIIPNSEEVDLSISEFRHLTDELRNRARETLPRGYSILTRDNIIQLLPPAEDKSQCLDESCAVEIGRAIGAEYVTQGFVGKFQGMLTLTVELYESMSGNMLGSFVTESNDAKGLLGTIREKAPSLFAKLSEPRFSGLKDDQDYAKPQTLNPIPQTQKSRSSKFIAIGLNVLGATAIGFGVYKHADSNKLYGDYKKKPATLPSSLAEYQEFEKQKNAELQKSKDASKLRNISYGVGTALLTAGIAVHIWF
ncbi:MAG: hypothetical protein FWH22_01575 [Fibromonadales bacterium]|nr:hypothetical protein [Fibromonadales bacterium]